MQRSVKQTPAAAIRLGSHQAHSCREQATQPESNVLDSEGLTISGTELLLFEGCARCEHTGKMGNIIISAEENDGHLISTCRRAARLQRTILVAAPPPAATIRFVPRFNSLPTDDMPM